jgi:hypothetical protein
VKKIKISLIVSLTLLFNITFALDTDFVIKVCSSHLDNNKVYQVNYNNGSFQLTDLKNDLEVANYLLTDQAIATEEDLPAIQKAVDVYMFSPKKVTANLVAYQAGSRKSQGVSFIEFLDADIHMTIFDLKNKTWKRYTSSQCQQTE